MDLKATLIILLMFIIRLGIPLALLFGLSFLIEKISAHLATKEQSEPEPCWRVKDCNQMDCLARIRPGVPCWVARQIAEGRLPNECIDCPVYTRPVRSH